MLVYVSMLLGVQDFFVQRVVVSTSEKKGVKKGVKTLGIIPAFLSI